MSTSAKDRFDMLFQGKSKPSPLPSNRLHFAQAELNASDPYHVGNLMEQDGTTVIKQNVMEKVKHSVTSLPILTRNVPEINNFGAAGQNSRCSSNEDTRRIKYIPRGKEETPDYEARDESQENEDDESELEPISHGNLPTGRFCLLASVAKFPYKYMEDPDDRVSRQFFAGGRFYQRSWDLYYILAPESIGATPIYLLPYFQVRQLTEEISKAFEVIVDIPRYPFTLSFSDDGTPQPILLGTSFSRESMRELQKAVTLPVPNYGDPPPGASPDIERRFTTFREKCQRALEANKRYGSTTKKKKAKKRVLSAIECVNQLKRAERYFGLNPSLDVSVAIPADQMSLGVQASHLGDSAEKAVPTPVFSLLNPAPYPFESEPVFISVDVEAWEQNHNLITEVGISTLNTQDLLGIPPGSEAESWIKLIRSRHFRIKEHEHLVNSKFCHGNPDSFQYGKSEWITISEAAAVVDSCFEWPCAVQQRDLPTSAESLSLTDKDIGKDGREDVGESMALGEDRDANIKAKMPFDKSACFHKHNSDELSRSENRNLVLVGHNLDSDLSYLARLGSGIFNDRRSMDTTSEKVSSPYRNSIMASILETLDTAILYRTLRKESQPRSLGSICDKLRVPAWYPHNGGNDARYTLEALVKLVIEARNEEQTAQE